MFEFLKPKAKTDPAPQTEKSPVEAVKSAAGTVASSISETANAASPVTGKYIVQPGDSLSKIAKSHNVPLKQILDANPQIKNPDLIHPRDVINLG